MSTDDFLKSIESGNAEYSLDPGLMQYHLLIISLRNKLYLEHIICELYPKKKERAKVFSSIDKAMEELMAGVISDIHLMGEKRKKN